MIPPLLFQDKHSDCTWHGQRRWSVDILRIRDNGGPMVAQWLTDGGNSITIVTTDTHLRRVTVVQEHKLLSGQVGSCAQGRDAVPDAVRPSNCEGFGLPRVLRSQRMRE